jgi:hypothetical protein
MHGEREALSTVVAFVDGVLHSSASRKTNPVSAPQMAQVRRLCLVRSDDWRIYQE